jgi:hypothetical protein
METGGSLLYPPEPAESSPQPAAFAWTALSMCYSSPLCDANNGVCDTQVPEGNPKIEFSCFLFCVLRRSDVQVADTELMRTTSDACRYCWIVIAEELQVRFLSWGFSWSSSLSLREFWDKQQTNSVALVRERTIPTERPLLVGGVSTNFCG